MGNVLELSTKLYKRYGNDPVGWIRKYISFAGLPTGGLTSQQELIARSIVEEKRVCVAAGGGLGKSAIAAMLIQWFLITHPMSKIPTTAPTGKTLRDALWAEVALWLKRNKLAPFYDLRADRLLIKGYKEWFAVARTIPKQKKDLDDVLAGFHAPFLFTVVDESSGVPDPVFTAIEGAMTQQNSYILLISNPVSTGGYFYDTITDPEGKGSSYKVIFLSSLDSPLVSKSYEQEIIKRYGKNSAMYRAKVLGQPILLSENVVVDPATYDEVTSRRDICDGTRVIGLDVAGKGENAAVFCHRVGNSIVRWDSYPKSDTTFLIDRTVDLWRTFHKQKQLYVVVDSVGLGAGVYDELNKLPYFNVIGWESSRKATNPNMYANRRAEMYHLLHLQFPDLSFPVAPPERLKKELANLVFDMANGIIKMAEDKRSFSRRLGFSPDYADALALTCVINTDSIVKVTKLRKKVLWSMGRLLQRRRIYGKYKEFVKTLR